MMTTVYGRGTKWGHPERAMPEVGEYLLFFLSEKTFMGGADQTAARVSGRDDSTQSNGFKRKGPRPTTGSVPPHEQPRHDARLQADAEGG